MAAGFSEDILDEGMRLSELSNWITSQVRR